MRARVSKFFTFKKLAILIVLAVVVFFFTQRNGNGAEVETATVERGEVTSELVLSGSVNAASRAVLNFPGSSTMTELLVEEGQKVTKGQRLGSIDTVSLNATLAQAASSHRAAQATVDRVYDQLKGKEKTETFEEIEARTAAEVARDNAYENLVKAQKALRDAVFYSPIEGVVTFVGVKTLGGSTTIGTPAFEIVDPTTLYFQVTADQTEIGEIAEGEDVVITLDPFEDQTFAGRVVSVGFAPKAGEVETVYEIKVSLDNLSNNVRVGMTGDARFSLEKKGNVLFVPPSFVQTDKEGKYVTLEGNKKVYVELGIEGEDRVEISGDIKEGDIVYD